MADQLQVISHKRDFAMPYFTLLCGGHKGLYISTIKFEELEDLIVGYIYSKPETDTYMRTYEMSEKGLVTYKKLGKLNAEFYFDGKHIVTIDNPYHNVLDEGGTLEEMVDIASYGRIEDMRAYL